LSILYPVGYETIIGYTFYKDTRGFYNMLNGFALGLLFFVAIVLFYGIIVIHDIPYEIAKSRKHPQQDAIHVAGWVSLFTLHTIWPFLWIWATLYREDRGWGFVQELESKKTDEMHKQTQLLLEQLISSNQHHEQLTKLEKQQIELEKMIVLLQTTANRPKE
jgi:hypothetical protein